jgi:hypothetical protein
MDQADELLATHGLITLVADRGLPTEASPAARGPRLMRFIARLVQPSAHRYVSETAVTVVAVLSSLCSDGRLEPGHHSARARPRSFTSMPCVLAHPDRSGVQPAHRCPAPIPGRPPAATCAPGGSHAARQRVTQRPACPAVMPISDPVPPSPEANGALAPDCRQGSSVSRTCPAEPYLPVSLTGLGAGASAQPVQAA